MESKTYAVKITIVKTQFYPDLVADVDLSVKDNESFGPCPFFNVGDVMLVRNIDHLPDGFKCLWAWADIERDIALILYGGQPQPLLTNPHSMYSCCDEGLRPVIFKLERVLLDEEIGEGTIQIADHVT